ncbi:DUF234 domain-containing protein [Bacteroides oleiciplenus]|uniref:DUF234 domain-containing protein n=2 Tax=Bacteroides oleiciplenus TaxID=626931 RepID=K9E1B6_9BACE|nr:DUF234 domain-containing protein [Bacteroides oleiciplenus]EKU90558.1 hypothetical protein HMPREF9447_01976 [Bacteroides oleiciplenus YIT 12058]RGN39350.1 hypothetical protein DXB65_03205 [Bacteroides oleiciplenus]
MGRRRVGKTILLHKSLEGKLKILNVSIYFQRYNVQYSEWIFEKYFRERVVETMNITQVGNCWATKGENEIDLIALNDFEKDGIVAEVKRHPNKISHTVLAERIADLLR